MKRITVTKREVYEVDEIDLLIRMARWDLPQGDLSLGDFGKWRGEEFLCVEIEDEYAESDISARSDEKETAESAERKSAAAPKATTERTADE